MGRGATASMLAIGAVLLLIGLSGDALFHLLPQRDAAQLAIVLGDNADRAHVITAIGVAMLLFVGSYQALIAPAR